MNCLECSNNKTNAVHSKRILTYKSLKKGLHTESVKVASAEWHMKGLIKCVFMICVLMYLSQLTSNYFLCKRYVC